MVISLYAAAQASKLVSETPLCLHAESGGQVVWLGTAELGTDLGTAP